MGWALIVLSFALSMVQQGVDFLFAKLLALNLDCIRGGYSP
jgi:hypothetical protein